MLRPPVSGTSALALSFSTSPRIRASSATACSRQYLAFSGVCTMAPAGDCAMAPAITPSRAGLVISAVTIAPPEDSPKMVMRSGSPPKARALAWIHLRASMMSESPALVSMRSSAKSLPKKSWPNMPSR